MYVHIYMYYIHLFIYLCIYLFIYWFIYLHINKHMYTDSSVHGQVPQGSGNELWLSARQRAVEMLHGHWATSIHNILGNGHQSHDMDSQ
jgi:3-deoxy-D-arabino-heptulosonate 7-phosphate (DAHP) synthase class II